MKIISSYGVELRKQNIPIRQNFEEMRIRLKESTEEKIQYDKESKELISNISHDLKTPITAIKGYAEGLMEGVASSPEKRDKYIRTIRRPADNGSNAARAACGRAAFWFVLQGPHNTEVQEIH